MKRLLFLPVGLIILALVSAVPAAASSAPGPPLSDVEVVAFDTVGAGGSFSWVEDGQSFVVMASAGRSERSTSPGTTTEVSASGALYFQRYNSETGEVYSWGCDLPGESLEMQGRWTARIRAAVTCGDGVAEFPVTVDFELHASSPVNSGGRLYGSERYGEARLSLTVDRVTYVLVSAPQEGNIGWVSAVDPVRTDRVVFSGESSGFARQDVTGLSCVGITDLYAVRESVATNVAASSAVDALGTYHLHALGTIGYSILGGDGRLYHGTATVRINETTQLDGSGMAETSFSLPVTLTTLDGASVAFEISGLIGADGEGHVTFGATGAHCA